MQRREFMAGGVAASVASGAYAAAKAASAQAMWVPQEHGRHAATLMQWPVNKQVYRDQYFLEITQLTIANIANAISEFEPVTMLADKVEHGRARRKLSSSITLWDIPTDDLWCRDSGPLFALTPNDKMVVSHIQFNGWGGKQPHNKDKQVAARVARHMGLELVDSGLQGEAGGVEHDGRDLLLAHESSWVNRNRNPGLNKDQIESRLLATYGAQKMIWSKGVRGLDITDYHIDGLARFTTKGRVLLNMPAKIDPSDPFHRAALATQQVLQAAKAAVTVIPEPTKRRVKSVDFVASYANYYVCNGAVIAASFGDKRSDKIAVEALKAHYPGREVKTLNVDALGELGGGIHCATQQIPAI